MKVYAIRNRATGALLSGQSRRPVYTRKADAIAAAEGYLSAGRILQIVEYTLGVAGGTVVHEFSGFASLRVEPYRIEVDA